MKHCVYNHKPVEVLPLANTNSEIAYLPNYKQATLCYQSDHIHRETEIVSTQAQLVLRLLFNYCGNR